jgi:hypothetical protein
MKIHELLKNDVRKFGLANKGQAQIDHNAELARELKMFVCDGEYGKALDRILASYLANLDNSRQVAAWVSGFYGSGKSHLLKMLGHLWLNTPTEEGDARTLVSGLPDSVQASLRELDIVAERKKVPRFAAMGTLPAGNSDMVFATILSVILRAKGLPEQVHLANFVLWLREEGHEEAVRKAVAAKGKDWNAELNNLYVSPIFAEVLLGLDPKLGKTVQDVRLTIREQYRALTSDLTAEQFVTSVKRVLVDTQGGPLPVGIVILDEVQAYIADNPDRAQKITDAAQIFMTKFDNRIMLVGAGQSALSTSTPNLIKLRDRFMLTVQLSDADVETVTRKVLLTKKAAAEPPIRELFDKYAGEINGILSGTRIQWVAEDERHSITDYPLLPQQRRFWERALRSIDPAGSNAQLRSQLRNLLDALVAVADEEIGAIIPGDKLFDLMSGSMLNTGILQNEVNERIKKLNNGKPEGLLRSRIAGLVFLINRLPREAGLDDGIRANEQMIGDLLLTDLKGDTRGFREQVKKQLAWMAEKSELMVIDGEYRIQTRQGAEWNARFIEKVAAFNSSNDVHLERERLFKAAVGKVVDGIRLQQGAAKERRSLVAHYSVTPPEGNLDGVVVWARDEWSAAAGTVLGEAQQRPQDDPVIHLFIPKRDADNLKALIVQSLAANDVIASMGTQSTPEGREAAQAMAARLDDLLHRLGIAVQQIMQATKLYRGKGVEVGVARLEDALLSTAMLSLDALYPRFGQADSDKWSLVQQRIKQSSDEPFQPVGHPADLRQHPVSLAVIAQVGEAGSSGTTGSAIRKHFRAPPFGWPQDAIDAALMGLLRDGVFIGRKNGVPVQFREVDLSAIPQITFIAEAMPVSPLERVQLRGILNTENLVNVPTGKGEEFIAPFFAALRELAAYGEALPGMPAGLEVPMADAILAASGGHQVKALLAEGDAIRQLVANAKARKAAIDAVREPLNDVISLRNVSDGVPELKEHLAELSHIIMTRTASDSKSRIETLRRDLEAGLRVALKSADAACESRYAEARAQVEQSDVWQKLPEAERTRLHLAYGFEAPRSVEPADFRELVSALASRSLSQRNAEAYGYSGKAESLLREAAQVLEPKAQTVSVDRRLLKTPEDLQAWLKATETKLAEALKKGPVNLS